MADIPQRNIVLVIGDTYTDSLSFTDDRSGYTFRAQLRAIPVATGAPEAELTVSVASSSNSTSVLTLTLSSASSSILLATTQTPRPSWRWWGGGGSGGEAYGYGYAYAPGRAGYWWDVQQTDLAGAVTTILGGFAQVRQDVTHA